MHGKRGWTVLVALALAWCAPSDNSPRAAEGDEVVVGRHVTFASKILGEERRILVALPDGYEAGRHEYPVVYLLDGHEISSFASLAALASIQADRGKIPRFIVVGIDTRPGYSRNTFPLPVEGWPESGGADRFITFLGEELIPFVDGRYRTNGFGILGGQSNSGMLAVYTLLTRPDLFDAYIAASPMLGWCPDLMKAKAAAYPPEDVSPKRYLYIAYGSDDYPDLVRAAVGSFVEVMRTRRPESLVWTTGEMDGGGHVPFETFHRGLEFIFPDWDFSPDQFRQGGVEDLERHYDGLTRRYGFPARAPESVLGDLGYELRKDAEWRQAASLFEYWVRTDPDSARARYGLAAAREKLGEYDRAAAHCRAALKLDPGFEQARELLGRIEARGEE